MDAPLRSRPPEPPSSTATPKGKRLRGKARAWRAEIEHHGIYKILGHTFRANTSKPFCVVTLVPYGSKANKDGEFDHLWHARLSDEAARDLGYRPELGTAELKGYDNCVQLFDSEELVSEATKKVVYVVLKAKRLDPHKDPLPEGVAPEEEEYEQIDFTPTPPTSNAVTRPAPVNIEKQQPAPMTQETQSQHQVMNAKDYYLSFDKLNPYLSMNVKPLLGRAVHVGKLLDNGGGKVKSFSFSLRCQKQEVRACVFGESAVLVSEQVKNGLLVELHNWTLVADNPRFRLPTCTIKFELRFGPKTVCKVLKKPLAEQVAFVGSESDDCVFVSLSELATKATTAAAATPLLTPPLFDVALLVVSVSDVREVTTKVEQKKTKLRELTLVDDTGTAIDMVLWGDRAMGVASDGGALQLQPGAILVIKAATAFRKDGLTLALTRSSQLSTDLPSPCSRDQEELFGRLLDWWQRHAAHWSSAINTRLTVKPEEAPASMATLEDQKNAAEDARVWCAFVCVTAIKCEKLEDWTRLRCLSCGKNTLVKLSSGSYICDAVGCAKSGQNVSQAATDLCLRITVADATTSMYVTLWKAEHCKKLLGSDLPLEDGTSATVFSEKVAALSAEDRARLFHSALGRYYYLKTRVKRVPATQGNLRERVDVSVLDIEPIAYSSACEYLSAEMDKYRARVRKV